MENTVASQVVACTKRREIMANMLRAYTGNENWYSEAKTEKFYQTFRIFIKRCDQADIPEEDCHCAFSIMLVDSTREFVFDVLSKKNLYLMGLSQVFKERLTAGKTAALIGEWESLKLISVMMKNLEKHHLPVYSC